MTTSTFLIDNYGSIGTWSVGCLNVAGQANDVLANNQYSDITSTRTVVTVLL